MGGGNILAPLGQALTQAMQSAHFEMSVTSLFSLTLIASVGQMETHLPQSLHEGVDMGVAATIKSASYG